MDIPGALAAVWRRIPPDAAPSPGWWLVLALVATALAVSVPLLWRLTRPAVTIVHELGHAVVGVLCGRRFTGFVVSADMSGHAVTVGPSRGFGRIASTWAGYPAPAILGALLVQIALAGWGRTALFAALLALVLALVFSRSLHTVLAVLATAAGVGALWWWGGPGPIALLTLAAGAFLLLGAWRHLGAVIASGRSGDDPAQLSRLTALPAGVWSASFALVLAACTLWAGAVLAGPLGDLL
ncbi:M50 family metallopeptidase [Brachybacterium sp. J153]|uniref:M50 family metallopeptidase n=1 Tax=Brachybacterium sp. J153 TaxID=3116488 RepID=UPI002E7A18BE|nr:M50 family metallopeptidase [Brachybacterium sp. J153]MEE1619405.1 M50 family metallopeptidase [Brachybacterium sp. J153]